MSAEPQPPPSPLRDAMVARILRAVEVAAASAALVIALALGVVLAQSCDANRTTRAALGRLGR